MIDEMQIEKMRKWKGSVYLDEQTFGELLETLEMLWRIVRGNSPHFMGPIKDD